MAIEAGQTAPDFTLNNQDDNPVKLSELRGKKVLLYFVSLRHHSSTFFI